MRKMSDLQRETLNLLLSHVGGGQVPISRREIAQQLGTSIQNAQARLEALRSKGWITWEPERARSIRLRLDRLRDASFVVEVIAILRDGWGDTTDPVAQHIGKAYETWKERGGTAV